jgi:hypothetical protein
MITEATSCGVFTSFTFFLNLYWMISDIDILSISDEAWISAAVTNVSSDAIAL